MDITLSHPCPGCPSALKHGKERTFHTTTSILRSTSHGSLVQERTQPGQHIRSTSRGHRPWHTDLHGDIDWTSGATKRQLMVSFSRLDRNADGVLEFWEMQRFLHKQNPHMTDAELRGLFRKADKDCDGVVRFNEFEDFMRTNASMTQSPIPLPAPEASAPLAKTLPSVSWSKEVPVPFTYWERGCCIPETELRGITLAQLQELADLVKEVMTSNVVMRDPYAGNVRVTWPSTNMYHIDPHFVRPLTVPFLCSFVELVASKAQKPMWFVSHFWGTPFSQTVNLIAFHVNQRALPPMTSPYWICTFANNQHDLSELGTSLKETPFVKAILSPQCQGTLTLMDQNATTLERVWCVLENYVSTNWARAKDGHLIDIAAWLPRGSGTFGGQPVPPKPTLRMELPQGTMKEVVKDPATGGAFPLTVSHKGSAVDVFKAKASHPEDRKRILHLIAGTEQDSLEDDPPLECDAYKEMNRQARRMFAPGAMYGAALRGDTAELQQLLCEHSGLQNSGIGDGATPLYAAAWKSQMEALRILLKSSANPNVAKEDGATPLYIAAQAGNKEVINELISARADVNQGGAEGVMPIFWAVRGGGDGAMVKQLLAAKANPDAQHKGWTPLLRAADLGVVEPLRILLANKANPNHVADGNTPLGMAKRKGFEEVVKALVDAGATKDGVGTAPKGFGKTLGAFGHSFAEAGADMSTVKTSMRTMRAGLYDDLGLTS